MPADGGDEQAPRAVGSGVGRSGVGGPSLAEDPVAMEQMAAMLAIAPLHHFLGLTLVEVTSRRVVVTMGVTDAALNSTGNLHGGSLSTLIDVAAGSAAAVGSGFQPGRETIVTADLHVRYLGRPRGDVVRAEASVLRAGRQLVVVECRVLDGDRVIATADFSSMIVPLRQPLRQTATPRDSDPDL